MGDDWRAAGARIDALIAADPAGREDLVREVTDLYGAGLERLLDVLHEAGALTDEVLAAVAADELVSALLLVHGLHPDDAGTRIAAALARTGVELVEVTDRGVCRLRVAHGQPPAGLEDLVTAAAPEITAVEVSTRPALIPVSALFSRVAEPT
ncbi:hypothetical protein [Paractinoplanes rishiriensis]|uniref:Uncharacterized protein n=1 Tax=Paractinoplanes rishiriensis TaxID=1050105 RepID=A0A919K752_9ACTN|nr:hypothetical protein [Actinoplanes rishiriensis]GIF00593.1 hypothetical protein Ari01nite_80570 [Actinoplanes rishiriensis]